MEWQQLLSNSGISGLERERNPQAVIEVTRPYQKAQGTVAACDVWGKTQPENIPPPERRPNFQYSRLPPLPPAQPLTSSRPAPSAPSRVVQSVPTDRSKSQRSPCSPPPQSSAPSKSQREAPRAPSSAKRGPADQHIGVGQRITQRHHVRERVGEAATPPNRVVASVAGEHNLPRKKQSQVSPPSWPSVIQTAPPAQSLVAPSVPTDRSKSQRSPRPPSPQPAARSKYQREPSRATTSLAGELGGQSVDAGQNITQRHYVQERVSKTTPPLSRSFSRTGHHAATISVATSTTRSSRRHVPRVNQNTDEVHSGFLGGA
jgi:hypothetical protein